MNNEELEVLYPKTWEVFKDHFKRHEPKTKQVKKKVLFWEVDITQDVDDSDITNYWNDLLKDITSPIWELCEYVLVNYVDLETSYDKSHDIKTYILPKVEVVSREALSDWIPYSGRFDVCNNFTEQGILRHVYQVANQLKQDHSRQQERTKIANILKENKIDK